MPGLSHTFKTDLVNDWFRAHARDLPWRAADRTPWGVLVSEVMLQQTPVARVEPVWRAWMERWPAPVDLARAEQADVIRAWDRLGYPRRALRLRECAKALVERHDGEVPDDSAALLALPGVGEYTAAAVRVFAFGRRDVVLDTNVRRVIGRAWKGEPLPKTHLTRGEKNHAAALVPKETRASALWNAGAMELGALVCTARAPRCGECVLADQCAWNLAGKPGLDGAPKRTQAWRGTDRQVRGRVMALLRMADAPVTVSGRVELEDVEPGQLDRCVESLVEDGLARLVDATRGTYSL